MADLTTVPIPIYISEEEEEPTFEHFDISTIGIIEVGNIQRKGRAKNNKSEIKNLLSKNNNLFSKMHMDDEYFLKNQFLVGYNICYYTFQKYDIFLMNGSPHLLDQLCKKTLQLLKDLSQRLEKNIEKKQNCQQRNQNGVKESDNQATNERNINSKRILELMKEDLENIQKFNQDVAPQVGLILDQCQKQYSEAYKGKIPLYQRHKYIIFKIIQLLIKFFSITLLLSNLSKKEQDYFLVTIKSNLAENKAAQVNNENESHKVNQEFLLLRYLNKICQKSKFESNYATLKNQIEDLQKQCQNFQQASGEESSPINFPSAKKDLLSSFVKPTSNTFDSSIVLVATKSTSTTLSTLSKISSLDLQSISN